MSLLFAYSRSKKGGFGLSSANIARRRAEQLRRVKSRRGSTGEGGGMVRLVICGVIFVLLVAVKLLFPEAMDQLAGSAQRLIGRDADFQEAFAAVGRAVSGEQAVSDSLQDAYTAVFNPTPPEELEPAAEPEASTDAALQTEPQPESIPDGAAALLPDARQLRYGTLALPEADKVVMREMLISPGGGPIAQPAGDGGAELPTDDGKASPEEDGTDTAEAVSLYTMAALPENASLEQRNLGFAHCTPVAGHLTSTFGWREHPVEGGDKFHYGVDLGAESGTDVLAFASGEVYAVGESSTLGNYVMLRHESGYITLYAHCSRVTVTGGQVAMGDKIAEVGATGLVTGPHLHFELHDGELYLNPIYYVDVG